MRVAFLSDDALKDVKRISVIRPGSGEVHHLLVRGDDDADGSIKVTLLRPGLGVVRRLKLEQPSTGKKKQSRMLKPLEKGLRKLVKRELEIGADYLERHERANRRESNGWIKHLPRNVIRAVRSDR